MSIDILVGRNPSGIFGGDWYSTLWNSLLIVPTAISSLQHPDGGNNWQEFLKKKQTKNRLQRVEIRMVPWLKKSSWWFWRNK